MSDLANLMKACGVQTGKGCSSGVRERLAVLPRKRWEKLRVKEMCQGVCDGECSRWVREA